MSLRVVTDEGAVVRKVSAISNRARTPGPELWNRIGQYMRQVYRRQFATEGAYLLGRRWQPLSPKYATWKADSGHRSKMLNLTGDLRRSYTVEAQAETKVFSPHAVGFGSSNRLAPFHEFGTRSHKTGRQLIPARPVVVETQKMRQDIAHIVRNYLVGQVDLPLPSL